MKRFFTQEEIYLMLDHGVPIETAKQRIRQGMDRYDAMTKPLKWTKGKRLKTK